MEKTFTRWNCKWVAVGSCFPHLCPCPGPSPCVVGDRMLSNSTFSLFSEKNSFGYKCALCSYGGKSSQKEMHLTRNTKIRWFQNVHMLSNSFVMKCAIGDVSSFCRVSVCVTVFLILFCSWSVREAHPGTGPFVVGAVQTPAWKTKCSWNQEGTC